MGEGSSMTITRDAFNSLHRTPPHRHPPTTLLPGHQTIYTEHPPKPYHPDIRPWDMGPPPPPPGSNLWNSFTFWFFIHLEGDIFRDSVEFWFMQMSADSSMCQSACEIHLLSDIWDISLQKQNFTVRNTSVWKWYETERNRIYGNVYFKYTSDPHTKFIVSISQKKSVEKKHSVHCLVFCA